MNLDANKHEHDLMTCVHCGFCLNSCPTYLVTGSEADSPRGRITIMRAVHERQASYADSDVQRHLDLCLGCRACEPACPSGVPYGSLIETARAELNKSRNITQLQSRKILLNSLADPVALSFAMTAAEINNGAMPELLALALQGDPSDPPTIATLPKSTASEPLPMYTPAIGKRRVRVGLLTGCVMKGAFNDIHHDTIEVLAANGCEVIVNQVQGCCGALHLHNGFEQEFDKLARNLIDSFGPLNGLDAIIINSAGCGSTLKEYGALFAQNPKYTKAAATVAKLSKDVNEFLDELGWIAPLKSTPINAAYHDACHLAHAQRITEAPRNLLKLIPELNLIPLPESDICCGSAGIYNLTEPAMAKKLLDRKVTNIVHTGATTVVTANPGCLAWIATGLNDYAIDVIHPITLLRRSLCSEPMHAN